MFRTKIDRAVCRLRYVLPDSLFIRLRFWTHFGFLPNLKSPQTFSEKIQWLKLYNRKQEYTNMVDKYAVKKLVAEKIGEEYLIPTIGIWDTPEDIDWNMLPNQFVLKTTHGGGGGGVVVCRDKVKFDKEECIKKLRHSMNTDIYWSFREWPYKNVKKRIIAEKYINPIEGEDLPDYKMFCFNGIPHYCQVISGRAQNDMRVDFYDMEWNHMPFHEPHEFPFADQLVPKPLQFEKMKELSQILASDIPFVRIDFYNLQGKIYFGEITFYPTSGLGGFSPVEWDNKFGKMIALPE